MSKRRLTPDCSPPPKHQHTAVSSQARSRPQAGTLSTLYDEIILVIFSYLSCTDLCAVQRTNCNWSRLALDNQLWKRLYLNEYGRARLRGVRGFIGRNDGREVKSLPGRAKPEEDEDGRNWKWMFRISSNWRTGRCSTVSLPPSMSRPIAVASSTAAGEVVHGRPILLAGPLIVSASHDTTHGPTLSLVNTANTHCTLSCQTSRTTRSTTITKIALDQSPPSSFQHARVAVFLSTGEFIIFSINHCHPAQSSRLIVYQPTSRIPRTAPIVQAVYHGRLLITLSQSFHLSLYDVASGKIAHTQTLSSFTSYPPSSLVLTPTSVNLYKLVLAYAIPVFPVHWSVGTTELIISNEPTMVVTSSRTTRAMDIPIGWMDEQKMRAVREQWGRKVERVADTQTDGKWVVLAPSEAPRTESLSTSDAEGEHSPPSSGYKTSSLHSPSSLQLYRVHFPTGSSGASSPKLTFVRTLHGQIGPVCAISLADGRCVSLGVNGSICVWDLEAGSSATEVYTGRSDMSAEHDEMPLEKGTIVFDERRIISTGPNGIELRRFDI